MFDVIQSVQLIPDDKVDVVDVVTLFVLTSMFNPRIARLNFCSVKLPLQVAGTALFALTNICIEILREGIEYSDKFHPSCFSTVVHVKYQHTHHAVSRFCKVDDFDLAPQKLLKTLCHTTLILRLKVLS
jgi:hypothetical protein